MNDRVSEVYKGLLHSKLTQEHLKSRIEWMVSHVKGERVLDVGCSQGITSILLAQQGYKVIGIDADAEAISYAQNDLSKELEAVKDRMTFLEGDFLDQGFENTSFDAIILGEVIEHLPDPKPFIEMCYRLLKKEGIIVITTPFGILQHPDHFQTYYVSNFLELVSPYFQQTILEVIGKRICYRGFKKNQVSQEEGIDRQQLLKMLTVSEEAFLEIENMYLEEIAERKARSRNQQESLQQYRTQLKNKQAQLNDYREKLKFKQEKLEEKQQLVRTYKKQIQESNQRIKILENQLKDINNEFK
jgi:2-polyprenyl-6-hydroxyphenyl methylase/3-demethylubiquinone-9 3-methyltransferase